MVRYDQLHSMFQVQLIYKASTGFGKTQSMPIQWILMFSVNFIFVPKVAAAIISLVNCDQRDFTKRFSDSKYFQLCLLKLRADLSDIASCKTTPVPLQLLGYLTICCCKEI